MKASGSIEEFYAEFNIPLLVGLHFMEDREVNPGKGSSVKDEMFLPKSYLRPGSASHFLLYIEMWCVIFDLPRTNYASPPFN